MNTREAATRLGAPPGGPTKITVNDGTTVSKVMQSSATGPFIYVEVDSTRRTGVRELVLNVERTLRYDLYTRQRQLKAPKSTYLTLSDVVPPSEPEAKNVTKWEYAGAALALVLVLGFGIAYGFDRRAAARRRSPHPYDDFGGTSLPALTYRHARPAGAPLLATPVPQPGVSEKSSRSDSVPARRPPRELEETAEFQVVFDDEPGAETNETNKTNKTSEKNEKNEKDEKDEEKEPAPDATVPDLRTVSKTPEQRSRPFKVLGSAADDDGAADGSDGHGGGVAAPRAG
jgi:hypothetical protein